jgi:mannose-6-phosphate isomerase-like protein (cupin superfamily)
MLKKRFDKSKAELRHNGTVYALQTFSREEIASDISNGWAFLKKGMKIEPHRHPEKEIYIFISGKGYMWIGKEKTNVKRGDAVYIPPNYVHTARNDENKDLEFIWIKFH